MGERPPSEDVSTLLAQWGRVAAGAEARLLEAVQLELQRIAAGWSPATVRRDVASAMFWLGRRMKGE